MESLKISDYMNHRPVTFTLDMPVEEAVERLLQSHQTGGPVIDQSKKVVGFLSEQDCMEKMLESTYHNELTAKVSEIMYSEVLAVKPYNNIIELSQMMLQNKPKIYPVTDDDGYLVGVITRSDVLKAIDIHLHACFKNAV
ncbi:CBS domain-containing protein [Algicola sagamiensis]|uniref:CBS domain-containing protein n=1 Tax=Algicola sagamiensis TaxID=163869 RepID=UPI000477C6A2|nr:CBS domain-containing protein [Algicola sagamiensis]